MLETPTYFEFGVPATDTAKISFLCFDDEDEFDDWGCLLDGCRRNLKELSKNGKSIGGGRNLEHPPSQICYFEFLGFPDFVRRRDLKDTTALDTGDRKLDTSGVHNAGIAYVYKEDHPIKEGKDICAAYFDDDDNYLDIDAYALELRKGVLAFQTEANPEGFPYFAFKTTP